MAVERHRNTGEEPKVPDNTELRPRPQTIDALRGTISEPITTTSYKRGQEGQQVSVRLVTEGSGQFGLSDMQDNREWSGIFNHSILSARFSVHFASLLLQKSNEGKGELSPNNRPDPQRILDAMVVSHAGRRTWDEAVWYPEAAPDAEIKQKVSNETQGLQIIHEKVPSDVFELVAGLAHNLDWFTVNPNIHEDLNYRICSYVDHRTAQSYEPLNTRLGDFVLINFFNKNDVNDEIKHKIYAGVQEIINLRKEYLLGGTEQNIDLEKADTIAADLGIPEKSARLDRKDLMKLILEDAETEMLLQRAGIDTENITDASVPMPKWESEIRREYVAAAQNDILNRFSEIHSQTTNDNDFWEIVDQEFPENHWWNQIARELYSESFT